MTEFRILGPLDVREDGQPVDVGGGKQRALLAVLLLGRNQIVSTDRLIDTLWGENPPASAPNSLHAYASRLRRVLGADRLLRSGRGYELVIGAEELDLDRFERLLASGHELLGVGDAQRAADTLEPLSPCGRALHSRTSRTSPLRRRRSRTSRTSGSPLSKSGSRPTSQLADTGSSCRSWRLLCASTHYASAYAAS